MPLYVEIRCRLVQTGNAGSSVPSQRAFCPESVRHILFTAFSNYYSFFNGCL